MSVSSCIHAHLLSFSLSLFLLSGCLCACILACLHADPLAKSEEEESEEEWERERERHASNQNAHPHSHTHSRASTQTAREERESIESGKTKLQEEARKQAVARSQSVRKKESGSKRKKRGKREGVCERGRSADDDDDDEMPITRHTIGVPLSLYLTPFPTCALHPSPASASLDGGRRRSWRMLISHADLASFSLSLSLD